MKEVKKLGRQPIPTKEVFKIKTEHDGTLRYKTRIVSKGFKAIPGVDYTESASPVATDTSIRTVVAISLFMIGNEQQQLGSNDKWILEVFDVKAAFLNSEMGQTRMFIKVPNAMVLLGMMSEEEASETAFELKKSMYGNVDSALLFFRTFRKILVESLHIEQCKTDPCVFFKRQNGKLALLQR